MTDSKVSAAAWRAPVRVEGAQDQRANPDEQEALVDADLDTLATALYVNTDDLLKASPERAPWRPRVGIAPADQRRRAGHPGGDAGPAAVHQRGPLAAPRPRSPAAPVPLPAPAARLQQAAAHAWPPPSSWLIGVLARDTSLWTDDVWVVDSTPVECARSREAARALGPGRLGRVRLLRQPLPLLLGAAAAPACTLHGLPVGFALTGAKADERHILLGDPRRRPRPGRTAGPGRS